MQEAYEDAIAQNVTYIHRYGTQTYTKILNQLLAAEVRLTAQIASQVDGLTQAEAAAFIRSSYKTQRLQDLRESIRELARQYRQIVMAETRTDGKELFLSQVEFHEELLSRGVVLTGSTAAVVTPSQAYAAAVALPFNGNVLKQYGQNLETGVRNRVDQALRTSFVNSDTLQQSINAIRGTRALDYKDGVLNISRRGAEGLARTHYTHMANRAALHTFQQLGVEKIRFVATLDGRTTQICAGLDGKIWRTDDPKKRLAPQHFRCRSMTVADLGDYEPRGFRPTVADDRPVSKIPKSERKDKIGRVRQSTNYEKWFARQSAEYQRNWLGSSRYRLFKEGNLPIAKFVDYRSGLAKNFTIDQLRTQHKAIFERLGI